MSPRSKCSPERAHGPRISPRIRCACLPRLFFQVNTKGAEILIDLVMEALDPQEDELAVDLYCGAGTFTLPLARRCDFVAAVEAYGPAVRDLRRNLEINKLDNVDVIGGDAVREFPDQDADILVVDPPRAGLAPEAIGLIASTSAAMSPT